MIPIDHADAEARFSLELQSPESPEAIFDREWALTLLDRARTNLQEEYSQSGRSLLFERLSRFLTADHGHGSYSKLVTELEMSEGAIGKAVLRMRQRYARHIRFEIARTLAHPGDINEELAQLRTALRRP